ncbi:SCF ubiquitin ligase complex subunit [Rhodotorula kratochvilovae]
MSTLPFGAGPPRRPLPPHLVSDTPPTPSRSPSNASTGGEASGGDAEDESADESDYPDGDPDDPDASTLSLSHLGPALATPKPTASSPWPFNAPAGSGPSSSGVLMSPKPAYSEEAPVIPASSLPHEILLHILRLLPSSSLAPALRVCKAWCQCGVELLWHKLSFTSVAALYKMLQVLSLPDQTFPYPDFVRRINFHPLASEMSDRVIAKLLPCTRLERLTLTNCKALSSPAMCALLVQSHRLVALDLTDLPNVDDEVLIALAHNCPKIQGLNLSGCSKITDRGLEAIALGCPLLRRIKLRKCDLLTDIPIILLSLHCPLLLEVDLAFCTSVSSLAVMQLLRTSHALREISLPGCILLDDDAFPDASQLTLLPPATRDDRDASPLTPSGSAISAADGSGAPSPSPGPDALITSLSAPLARPVPLRSPPSFRPFDHLRYIDVTACAHLTDQSVAGIVKYCPRLRNLMLGKCTRLTDEALYAICGIGKHLHYLHLGHVNNITDAAVTAIARACTRLRYIDLACCSNLTDVSVFELAANLPRIKRIGLVRVVNITDDAIYSLRARTSLERIHLSYCDNLTVGAVNEMLQALPRVTHLSLTGVSSFRKRALQQFCRAPPKDFNDHQRRSFCVFSGRGVHDLRKFFRSLAPVELQALALPDPPEDPDAALQQQLLAARFGGAGAGGMPFLGGGGGGGGAPLPPSAPRNLPRQQPPPQHAQAVPWLPAPVPQPQAQAAAAIAAQNARLAAVQQARAAVAHAAQRLHAGGAGVGAGAAFAPGPGAAGANMLGLQQILPLPAGAGAGAGTNGAGGDYRAHAQQRVAFAPPPQGQHVPIQLVAPRPAAPAAGPSAAANGDDGVRRRSPRAPDLVEIDGLGLGLGLDGTEGEGEGGETGGRPRRGTVTQRNYRRAGSEAANAMDVDEEDEDGDGGSESGGEEEDISMG